ncbi:hypothetical protein EXW94_28175 [Enterobacter sp. JMULE2]|nr:hypothetical protein [Enterobacter sp. JMULE2]
MDCLFRLLPFSDGRNQKNGQGAGPLRLLIREAAQSSSPTPPGSCFAPASLRRIPSGFGLPLGSDG